MSQEIDFISGITQKIVGASYSALHSYLVDVSDVLDPESAEFRMRVLVKRRMINWDYGPKKKWTGTMAGPPIARTSLS